MTATAQAATELEATVARLCKTSIENVINPHDAIDWPETLDPEAHWFTSPEYITLFGTEEYEALSEAQRKRLSFYEAVNFYSLNIHGERLLIEGLSRRLYRRETGVLSPYIHHFLDEENKHMYYFGRFCTQYAGRVYPEKKLSLEREYAPGEEDFLFFACVVVFEEIVDVHNREMGKDDRLHPVSREINRIHHFEETRHLSFGRKVTADIYRRYHGEWSDEVRARVRDYIASFIHATWREYYNPEVYKDAGLSGAFALRRKAWDTPHRKALRQRVTRGCLRFFERENILTSDEVTL